MDEQKKIIVGISIGDLNGIGSEVVLKALNDSRILDFFTPVIFASQKLMQHFNKTYELDCSLNGINSLNDLSHNKINVFINGSPIVSKVFIPYGGMNIQFQYLEQYLNEKKPKKTKKKT